MMIIPLTSKLLPSSSAIATQLRSGVAAIRSKVWSGFRMLRGPVGRGAFPPSQRLDVISLASSTTAEHEQTQTRWALDDLAAAMINRAHHDGAMSRSTIWRILDEADLKPHRSVYWLNSHDPEFDAKARDICKLYLDAPKLYEQGRLVICSDEKTGMQALGRPDPTQPAQPGKPEKRENDYIRHGTRVLITSFVVATGEVIGDLGATRTSVDFAAHLEHVAGRFPEIQGCDWVVDNLNTHWSLDVCRVIADLCGVSFVPAELRTGAERRAFLTDPDHKHVLHFTPTHGSWLNQVELWFSVMSRRFLKRGDFASMEDFEERMLAFLSDYNRRHAHPYLWTYRGTPLVRGIPFSQTRRQQQHGRAWFSTRPQRFERALYSPRPYKRQLRKTG
jgi:DDE superfamily endonuclease